MKVRSVEVKGIITPSRLPDADFVINPYVGCPHGCIYCYAEFMQRFSHHPEAWGEFIDVKVWPEKIKFPRLENRSVLLSSVTDPYNPYEAKYQVTRRILQQLAGSGARVSFLTKSKLLLRDLDLIKKLPDCRVGVSLNTLDEQLRRHWEPRASTVAERLELLQTLHREQIPAYLFLSPIFPGLTDVQAILRATAGLALNYGFENLNLRGGYKHRVLAWVRKHRPEVYPLYEQCYLAGDRSYWENLRGEIERWCEAENLNHKFYFYHELQKK